ncbi:major facilitator superfamily domain-containing protein [Halteromyces radiatus]|uniref:major facilitator superfamily domain-containing protein n=1 Tax=Halteromyces radiatus TaxID=101107 RepID=UPI00221E8DDF|nr:major facilitator superfamily domain-containing protein [Halteromyces radiatus]KAI8099978.1 major facilitator superfamily domain-containing protein [Halteromyces radiatus]
MEEKPQRISSFSISSEIEEFRTDNKPSRKFLWFIPLAPHAHPIQFFFLLIAVFTPIAVIVFIASAQSFYILIRIQAVSHETGDITGSLALYSEIISLVAVVFWGVFSDHHEKRTVMALGIIIMGIPCICYPYATNVYPSLLILRLIFSAGTAATTSMMAAFFIEVVSGKGGLVSGLLGASSGLGAIFSVFVLFMVPSEVNKVFQDYTKSLNISFGVIGGATVFVGMVLYFVLPKSPQVVQSTTEAHYLPSRSSSSFFLTRWCGYFIRGIQDFIYKIKRGVMAAKDPKIALGYTTSFFARADEIIISNFVSLWITQYYIEQGSCSVGEPCYVSAATSGTLTGIAQAVALVACPFFAVASEYLPKEFPIMAAGLIGAGGCIPFSFSIDPTSKASMALVVLIGIGQYGMIISGLTMVGGDHVPVAYRGSVAGTFSFFGALGIIVLSKLGGVLFDRWMKGAPFLLLGIGHCIVLVLAFSVYLWEHFFLKKKKKKKKNYN